MKYCQECGSEIGETVTFCPYCGINQKTAQEKEDDEQDNTIAFNQRELADLVGNKIETAPKDLLSNQSEILSEAERVFSERQVINKEFEQPRNVAAENQASKKDSVDISPQFILNTDDSFKVTRDKEVADNELESSDNTELRIFDEKAEMFLKSQIELQRMIFVQNQRIIELLEQLLEKGS
jgi:hypothetical protein